MPPFSNPASERKRILLVDDHPFMRMGLAQYLNAQPDFMVCAEAADPKEAMAMIEKMNPDLVLSDLNLPGKGGLELIKDIRAMHSKLPILVLSMHDEPHYAPRVLRAGARGYLMKSESVNRLAEGIRDVFKGRVVVSERMSSLILEIFAGKNGGDNSLPEARLSDRELEILALVGSAHSTRRIGERLNISMKTVEAHRSNIKQKLGITSSQELVRYAICWAQEGGCQPDRLAKSA
jgi:DNA-binding NarL/FixJ family response regulator